MSCLSAAASTYYVDYDGGSDSNDGSLANPWKHCTGDPNATDNAAGATYSAGDVIAFKGGVTYRGKVALPAAGTVANPTIYSGDTWGTGKAIIDGSEVLTNWTKCTAQGNFPPNTNWANIYYTKVPVLPDWVTNQHATAINFWQSNLPLVAAQWPLSSTILYQSIWSYLTPESSSTTAITDADLATFGGPELTNAMVYGYSNAGNENYLRRITGYDDGAKSITFPAMSLAPDRYAVINSATSTVFNAAGQYWFDRTTSNVFVWPYGDANLVANECVTWSWQPYGFHATAATNIVISGFIFQKQTGDSINDSTYGKTGCAVKKASSGSLTGITITNCEIRYTLMEGDAGTVLFEGAPSFNFVSNYVHDTRGRGRGVQATTGAGISIVGNIFSNVCRTVIYTEKATNLTIANNYLVNSGGVHGNGISPYASSEGIDITNNTVINCNFGITVETSGNLRMINNIVDRQGSTNDVSTARFCFAWWGYGWGTNWILNNTLLGSASHLSWAWAGEHDAAGTKIVLINNILDGGQVLGLVEAYCLTNDHNLFLYAGNWFWATNTSANVTNTDVNTVMVDVTNKVYRLGATSPAVNAGADLSAYGFSTDIIGTARSAWDIGAYEYSTALDPTLTRSTMQGRATFTGRMTRQ